LVKKLQTSADAGNKEARDKLNFFRWCTLRDLMRDLEKMSKAGQHSSPPPILTILEMADFAIPLLLWLTEHQRENIKGYARDRWAWPAYASLMSDQENRYDALLPTVDQSGTKIIIQSPIALGENLGYNISKPRTACDSLFQIAAIAIRDAYRLDEGKKNLLGLDLRWLRAHHKPLLKLEGIDYQKAAEKHLVSRGKFTRQNWKRWKPVFETYLTFYYAPPKIKFEIFPEDWKSNAQLAIMTRTEMQWLELYKKKHPMSEDTEKEILSDLKIRASSYNVKPLQDNDAPEIRAIVEKRNKESSKWNALKSEILNRIYNLAPAS
jgi:hypothetical protein